MRERIDEDPLVGFGDRLVELGDPLPDVRRQAGLAGEDHDRVHLGHGNDPEQAPPAPRGGEDLSHDLGQLPRQVLDARVAHGVQFDLDRGERVDVQNFDDFQQVGDLGRHLRQEEQPRRLVRLVDPRRGLEGRENLDHLARADVTQLHDLRDEAGADRRRLLLQHGFDRFLLRLVRRDDLEELPGLHRHETVHLENLLEHRQERAHREFLAGLDGDAAPHRRRDDVVQVQQLGDRLDDHRDVGVVEIETDIPLGNRRRRRFHRRQNSHQGRRGSGRTRRGGRIGIRRSVGGRRRRDSRCRRGEWRRSFLSRANRAWIISRRLGEMSHGAGTPRKGGRQSNYEDEHAKSHGLGSHFRRTAASLSNPRVLAGQGVITPPPRLPSCPAPRPRGRIPPETPRLRNLHRAGSTAGATAGRPGAAPGGRPGTGIWPCWTPVGARRRGNAGRRLGARDNAGGTLNAGDGAPAPSFGVRKGTLISLPAKRNVTPSGRMAFTTPPAKFSFSRTFRGRLPGFLPGDRRSFPRR